jgi:hypothetical protein
VNQREELTRASEHGGTAPSKPKYEKPELRQLGTLLEDTRGFGPGMPDEAVGNRDS